MPKRVKMSFNMRLKDERTADLDILDDIGEWTDWWTGESGGVGVETITNFLAEHKNVETINVRINSNGGDVFEGIAIANLLRGSGKTINVEIIGIAASIASVIATAGDHVRMYPTSQMMIHNCWTYASGNANDFRKIADQMDAIMESSRTAYLDKADGKLSAEKLQEMLDAETYLPAEKCLEYGLCDEVIGKEPADPADPKPNEYKEPPKDPNFIAPTAKVKPWFF